jgi:hypothetical protein
VASLVALGVDVPTAAATASLHTVVTDVMGHRGLRRSKYHDVISIVVAVVISAYLHNVAFLVLGAIHILLDWASPGRLAVNWMYNLLWSLPPTLLLMHILP